MGTDYSMGKNDCCKQNQPRLYFSFHLLQVLLTCPWSEQPPTQAPLLEEEEEEERLEFDGGEVAEEVEEEHHEDVEVVEYEVVKEEEEDLWTKSMDEWAERQRSSALKPTCQFYQFYIILVAGLCTLK